VILSSARTDCQRGFSASGRHHPSAAALGPTG